MSSHSGNFKNKFSQGFTLIEMIVVIGIFVITTGILIADLPGFRNRGSLDLVAQEVATYLRGAQVYSAATLRAEADITKHYGYYEIAFDKNSNKFYLFGCSAGPFCANFSDPTSALETYQLPNNYQIEDLLANDASGNDYLHVSFKRPRMEASFSVEPNPVGAQSYESVTIKIKPMGGDQFRCVRVYGIGQIEVDTCST